jgi:thiosulfate reductase cytochrome b subunit
MNEGRFASFTLLLNLVKSLLGLYAFIVSGLWFLNGSEWFRETILPLHGVIFLALLVVTFLALIPLMVFKGSRPYSGILLLHLTYVFGGIAWFYASHYCVNFLGVFWFVVGLFFAGVGVAPVAVIGSIIKGHWEFLGFLAVQLVATFGCRFLAIYALSTSE